MKKPKLFTLLTLCCILMISIGNFNHGTADDRMINVTQDVGITLFRNGIPVLTTTEDGVPDAPILYQGTTYVRAYGLRQLFGSLFEWDNKQTITVSDAAEFATTPLIDMNFVDSTKSEMRSPLNANQSTQIQVEPRDNVYFVQGDDIVKCSAPVLVVEEDVFLPLRDVANLFGWVIKWNDVQHGVDIMSPDFEAVITEFLTLSSDETCIPREYVTGFRAYLFTNILHDSSTSVKMKGVLRRGSGGEHYYVVVSVNDVQKQLSLLEESKKQISTIIANLDLDKLSPREKVGKISGYVCSRFVYDSSIGIENALTAPRKLFDILQNEKQICEGYARLFTELCREAGIPAQYLLGYVKANGESVCHAWSRVYIDGEWLYCDPTVCDSSKRKDVALLITESQMIKIHQEISMAIRY